MLSTLTWAIGSRDGVGSPARSTSAFWDSWATSLIKSKPLTIASVAETTRGAPPRSLLSPLPLMLVSVRALGPVIWELSKGGPDKTDDWDGPDATVQWGQKRVMLHSKSGSV